MLVLLTTANFPDIMLPAYEYSRPFCIFFIIYIMIGIFLILHLLMALFYNNYKLRYEEQLTTFHSERDAFLEDKFNELDNEGKGYLNKQEAYQMFRQIYFLDQGYNKSKNQEEDLTIEDFDRMFFLWNS